MNLKDSLREKTLYIFRHGETDWNKAGRMQGGTDILLNETGRVQAQSLTGFFAQNPVEVFLCSDLKRAVETANIASGDLQVPFVLEQRLRETNLGLAEGLTADEINARFGAGTMERWRQSGTQEMGFSFPNGETKAEHLERNLQALEEFLQSTPYRTIGVASHGGAMRRLIHHFRADFEGTVFVGNCVVYRVFYDVVSGDFRLETNPVFEPFKS
jgi:broad specificity phosphatase PhoE